MMAIIWRAAFFIVLGCCGFVVAGFAPWHVSYNLDTTGGMLEGSECRVTQEWLGGALHSEVISCSDGKTIDNPVVRDIDLTDTLHEHYENYLGSALVSDESIADVIERKEKAGRRLYFDGVPRVRSDEASQGE